MEKTREKRTGVKIISITVNKDGRILGVGNNNGVYWFNSQDYTWWVYFTGYTFSPEISSEDIN